MNTNLLLSNVKLIKICIEFALKLQSNYYTHSSNNTAHSGKNKRCVNPAPCIPINMSVLYVICNCSLKVKKLLL